MSVYIYCVYIILQHNKTLKSAVVKHLLLQGTIYFITDILCCMPHAICHKIPTLPPA